MIPLLDVLGPIVSKVLDFIPDPQKKAEAQLKLQQELDSNSQKLLEAFSAMDRAQAETNTEEAKSANIFIAGWRPFIGWTCGAAFAWSFLIQPVLVFVLVALGRPLPNLPAIAVGEMMPVLMGMLGLAGMRSWEKAQGVHNEH